MNSTTNDSDRTPGDSHWRDMVNLKERYGHRFKVAYDESYYAERGDHGRAEDARLMVLLCDHGHMYPFGGDLLAASTDKRGAVAGRLAGLDCTTVVQDGDDGVKDLIEMTMRKMDQDRDGRVSYSDFMETVQEVRGEGDRMFIE